MTNEHKRYLGISILLLLVGIFKLYKKGLYLENGEINWFNVFVPFGMGIGALIYTLFKISQDKKK